MTRSSAALQGRSIRTRWSTALAVLAVISPAARVFADDGSSATANEPGLQVPGTLFICGGGRLPEAALKRFVDYAGGAQAHIVVITTASETADSSEVEIRIDFWKKARFAEMTVLHTRSSATADDPIFCKPLAIATGVWFIGGHQNRLTDTYRGTRTEAAIRGVLERGGVVGGTSAGAAVMSPVMIRGGFPKAETEAGFGFLPGTVIDQHFLKRKRENRLVNVLSDFPKLVGIGIDEGTAIVVQGRRLAVVKESESNVEAWLAPIHGKPARKVVLEPGAETDLVALRRAARARIEPRWRFDDDLPEPTVPEGTLVLVGGGETPPDAARRFVEAAGGPEALVVVVSTAVGDRPPPPAEATGWLVAAGAKNVRCIHPRTVQEAEEQSVLDLLRQAGGVWFTGGRQWRLVDAFADTAAERLLQEVLNRGGAVGGTAAGASILAAYLVRGNPLSNQRIMAEGYEEGFGLLPGTAIDQNFSQRQRFADMTELKQAFPNLVGLGLDEGAAVVVRGHEFEVLGRNRVCVFARAEPPAEGQRDFEILSAGERYDLRDRKRVALAESEAAASDSADNVAQDDSRPMESAADDPAEPQPQPALVCGPSEEE